MQRLAPLIIASAFMLFACDRPAPPPAVPAESAAKPAMPSMPQAPQATEHVAQGTLNSIDAVAGRVTISHGPVASAGWPGMTMSFKLADPGAAASLKPGQRVEFHFTIQDGMSATVTQISAAE